MGSPRQSPPKALLLLCVLLNVSLTSTQEMHVIHEFNTSALIFKVAMDAGKGLATVVAAGTAADNFVLWNLATGRQEYVLTPPGIGGWDAAVDFTLMKAAMGCGDNKFRVWDLNTGAITQTIDVAAFAGQVYADFSAMKAAIFHLAAQAYQVLDLSAGAASLTRSLSVSHQALDFNRLEMVTVYLGAVELWHLWTGAQIRSVQLPSSRLRLVAADFSARMLVTVGEEGNAWVVNLDTMEVVQNMTGSHTGRVVGVVADFSAMKAITSDAEGTAIYWDMSDGSVIHTLQHTNTSGVNIFGLAADFGAMQAATGGDDGQVVLWDLASGDATFRATRDKRAVGMEADFAQGVFFTSFIGNLTNPASDAVYWATRMPNSTTWTTTSSTTTTNTTSTTASTTSTTSSTASTTTISTATETGLTTTLADMSTTTPVDASMTTSVDMNAETTTSTNTLLFVTLSGSRWRMSPWDLQTLGLTALVMLLAQAV